MLQTLNIEHLKFKLHINLTKSPKRGHFYKLCLYMLEEHMLEDIETIYFKMAD